LRARIAVPIPGTAEVAALLDNAEVVDTRLAQTRGRQQSAEATTDNQHPDLVGQRFAGKARIDVRIVHVTAEVALHFDVLLIAVGADPPIALLTVLGTQGVGIEIDSRITILS